MFRNLRFYRLNSPWPETEQALSELLSEKVFTPCSAYSERSAGWEPPAGEEQALLCRRLAGADLVQLRTQTRILPAAAVKEALEERVAEYRARMEQEPPPGELRRLKEQTRDQLVPKALVKSDRTRACFIQAESLLAIDTATTAGAEWLLDHLRHCLGQFQCVPLAFSQSPVALLTRIFLGQRVDRFSLGRECRMQDQTDSKSIATWRDIDLDDPTIHKHVTEGMKLTHLGIVYDEIMSCVLSADATVGKIKFLEGEAVDTVDGEDPLVRLDADFVLLSGTIRRLFEDLETLLGTVGTVGSESGARVG